MKRKILTAIIATVCALCCAFGFIACGGNSSGNNGGGEQQDEIKVESVVLNKNEITLKEGEIEVLHYSFTPNGAEYKTLEWTSSDNNVATVNNGTVTAVSEGSCTVTLTTDNGKKASCTVTVVKNTDVPKPDEKVEEIMLSRTEITLYVGGEEGAGQEMLMAMLIPAVVGAEDRIEWHSSNESVAYIVGSGGHVSVVAADEGKTVVTAEVDGVEAVCTVTVERVKIDDVDDVEISEYFLRLEAGQTATLQAIITPAHVAQYYPVKWSSQDESVATVDENGTVTAVGAGVTTIIATAGGKAGVCSVRVEYIPQAIEVESVTFNQTEITLISGQETNLIATVLPENATDKTLVWNSSDWNIAQVFDNGRVTTRAVGTAIITATAANGKYAACSITVRPDMPVLAESVTLDKTVLALEAGGYEILTATVLPENAINKTLSWTSSDESIATVDGEGKVTAVSEGEAVITAKTGNLKYATCTVTVSAATVAVESVSLNKTQLTLNEGGEETLTATVLPVNATDKSAVWSSSDESVATVNENGKVTAVAAGTATITATAGGKIAECAVTVNALELEYTEITEGGEVVAYAVSGIGSVTGSHVIIPSTHNGKPVTAIAENAFYKIESITAVTIPQGVTVIYQRAFHSCKNLTQITIPDGLTSIGPQVFAFCTRLEKINLPDSIKAIEYDTFYGCENLTEVNIPDGVTYIGNSSFANCSKLQSINIPDGVTYVGSAAFESCKLTELVIPDSVTFIGGSVVWGVNLVSLTVPFVGEKNDGTGSTYFGYFFGAKNYGEQGSIICESLKTVTVTGGSIAANAFYGCSSITEINLSGVTSIGSYAFRGCSSVTDIVLSESINQIGSYAFSSCYKLKNINLPYGITKIDTGTFQSCSALTEVEIPSSVTSIASRAFYDSGIVTMVLPESVTSIDREVFKDCGGLKKLYIPKSVKKLTSGVLSGCTSIEFLSVPFLGEERNAATNNGTIGWFFGADRETQASVVPATLKTVAITDGGSILWQGAFENCSGITTVMLSKTITTIYDKSFTGSGIYTIYYDGTQSEWNSTTIGDYRAKTSATKYYYSETQRAGYWHYDTDGVTPVLW